MNAEHRTTEVPRSHRELRRRSSRFIGAAAVMAAVIGTCAAAVADRHDYTSDRARAEIHNLDGNLRDLRSLVDNHVRDESNESYYGPRHSMDEVRAMVALGGFEGEASALHNAWDHFPNAPLGDALTDFGRSFRNADQWFYRRGFDSEIQDRWTRLRRQYFQFRRDAGYDRGYDGAGAEQHEGGYYDRGDPGSFTPPDIEIQPGR